MPATSTIVVIGGGAAGFFAAVTCAEANPQAHITLLERSGQLLSKVRISGGGRCNVTHSLFDPALLVENYPRGGRALRGPLTRFGPRDTVQWFAARGVELVAEGDGRMFPVSNSSETIVDCLLEAAKTAGVEIRTKAAVTSIEKTEEGFKIELATGEILQCERFAAGDRQQRQSLRLGASAGATRSNLRPHRCLPSTSATRGSRA